MGRSTLGTPLLLPLLMALLATAQQQPPQGPVVSTSLFFPVPVISTSSASGVPSASVASLSAPDPASSSVLSPPPPLAPIQASQPLDKPLLALPTVLPSPIPSGVAKTASGRPIPCSPKNVKLNPTSHKLISECVETSFCAAPPGSPANATGLGVCYPRVCTREQWPYGYGVYGGGNGRKKGASHPDVPPLCPAGSFCPDNGSGCRELADIGSMCELARDEQCKPPPPSPNIDEKDNRSVCLKNICRAATEPIGAPCSIENTTYVSDIIKGAAGGGQFTSFVIKHNCLNGLFCDPTPQEAKDGTISQTCQLTKTQGEKCRFDAECQVNNCVAGICTAGPEAPYPIAAWQWLVVTLFLALLLAAFILVLIFIHRRQRTARYQELQDYYHEQMSLRQSIMALHTAAAAEKQGKPIPKTKPCCETQQKSKECTTQP